MIIACEKCNTRYKLREDAIPDEGYRARCQKCGHTFTVYRNITENDRSEKHKESVERELNNSYVTDCKIISICNQKGGVAKTSTCINLGSSLMEHSKRVLLVDFDVQANLSMLLGFSNARSFFEVMHENDNDLKRYIVKNKQGMWILPSNSKMALLTKKHMQEENFEYLLREKLRSVHEFFDYILIDTPPSGDFYTLNALLASNMAIIPAQCEYLAMNGVNHVVSMIGVIRERTHHELDYRVLNTMFDSSNVAARAIRKKFMDTYSGKMFRGVIERDNKIQESQIAHMPVMHYDRKSRAGQQYLELAGELIHG